MAELMDVLRGHCDAVGRDPAGIRLSKQVRWRQDADALLDTVAGFTELGVSEVIVVVAGDDPVGGAEQVAGLLPRLHTLG